MRLLKGWIDWKSIVVVAFLSLIGGTAQLKAQVAVDSTAFKILDKALGPIMDDDGASIYFEGIAYELKNPTDIFTLPVYKVFRGGYWIMSGNKFEMRMGDLKGLSDGQIMVLVQEQEGLMYVDSVRNGPLLKGEEMPDIGEVLQSQISDAGYTYLGVETLEGVRCHKIRADISAEDKTHVIYWVAVDTEKLFLMAEWSNESYTTYWVKSIGKAPKNYSFDIHLPVETIESYMGFQVIDMRYSSEDMREK